MTVRELFLFIGLDLDEKKLDKAEAKFGSLKKAVVSVAAALATGVVARSLARIVDESTSVGDAVKKASERLGINAQALQELQYAGELAGVETNALNGSLTRLGRNAAEAARGGGPAKDIFRELGISIKDAGGHMRPTEALLDDVADAMARTQDPAERTRIAMALFGREGATMVNLLGKGSGALREMRAELQASGGLIDDDTLARSEEYRDNLTRLEKTFFGLKLLVTKALLPAFNFFVTLAAKVVAGINRLLQGTDFLRVAFTVLGAAAIALGIKLILPFLPMIGMVLLVVAGITAIILVLEDLYQWVTGGQSLIGDLIARFLELESSNPILNGLLMVLQAVVIVLGSFLQHVGAIVAAMTGDFAPLSEIWGAFADAAIGAARSIRDFFAGVFQWIGEKITAVHKLVFDTIKQLPGAGLVGKVAGLASKGADILFGGGEAQAPTVTSNRASNSVVNAPNVAIEVHATGAAAMDPNALSVEVGRQVEEVLQRQADHAFSALVPAVGG